MEDDFESGEAFAIPDLWQKSSFAPLDNWDLPADLDRLSPFRSYLYSEPEVHILLAPQTSFALPSLDISGDDPLQTAKHIGAQDDGPAPFSYGPLEELEPLDVSTVPSDHEEDGELADSLEDLWSAKEVLKPGTAQLELRNWEKFYDRSYQEPPTVYISEAGPRVFDALLNHGVREPAPAPALQSDVVLSSLIQLAHGRESLLYRYNENKGHFAPVAENIRISGYSPSSFNSLTVDVVSYGSQIRRARVLAHSLQDSAKSPTASIALASGVNIIVSALQTHLGEPLASIGTVLQLQDLVQRPRLLLNRLLPIIDRATKVEDNEHLSVLFDLVQDMELSAPYFQPIMNHLLAYVARPWLDSVESSIGLRAELVVGIASLFDRVDGDKKHQRLPKFITSDVAKTMLETDQSLKLLQAHEPEHPMAQPIVLCRIEPPSFQWQFTWQDIDRIQAQAHAYEGAVSNALKEFNTFGTFNVQQESINSEGGPLPPGHDTSVEPTFNDLLLQVEGPLHTVLKPDHSALATAVAQTLCNSSTDDNHLMQPPISLTPTLCISPLLTAQFRLLAHSTLHLLFRTHAVRSHLRLLYSYALFSNGPFLVRLSHALFDPSLPSATFQRGRIRAAGREGGVGLQLGSREVWPPASSELRIALMGILTESYRSSFPDYATRLRREYEDRGELPGDLSFAIRGDMSDAELEKCINPDGLEALDFLKIGYRPPRPLDTVITTEILEKYERVSRLLLRGARLCWVVKSLLTDCSRSTLRERRRGGEGTMQRFKIESHHFVITLFSYFSNSIDEIWTAFEHRIDAIEAQLDNYEVGRDVEGVVGIKTLHEEVLDRILAACLLRKRQGKVMELLEEILRLVLQFAGVMRKRKHDNVDAGSEKEVGDLYALFRKKLRVFMTVCRGLQEQKSIVGESKIFGAGKKGEEMGNGIGRLVLMLDWGR
ncbi:MAG: hypothetical protein Q9218_004689 [Villophora microphyllina]